MSSEGNDKTLTAIAEFQRGEALTTLIEKHGFEVDIEVMPGLTARAKPYVKDGFVHLEGEVEKDGRKLHYHFSATPEDAEGAIRDAVDRNLPLRLAAWWKTNFGRLPVLRRSLGAMSRAPNVPRLIRFRG